jgi:hypothetical protein
MSAQANPYGHKLHTGEHRGRPVGLEGVPQIPDHLAEKLTWGGDWQLTKAEQALCDAAIEAAMAELRRRRLESLRAGVKSCG